MIRESLWGPPASFSFYLERKDGWVERVDVTHFTQEDNSAVRNWRPYSYEFRYAYDPRIRGVAKKYQEECRKLKRAKGLSRIVRTLPAAILMARICEDAGAAEELENLQNKIKSGARDLPVGLSPAAVEVLRRFHPSINAEKVRALFWDSTFTRRYRAVLKGGPDPLPCRAFKSDRIYPNVKLAPGKSLQRAGRTGVIVPAPHAVTGYVRIGRR